MEVSEDPLLLLRRTGRSLEERIPGAGVLMDQAHLVDQVLHFGLQAPPLELDRNQFVGAHSRAVRLTQQLPLLEEIEKDGRSADTLVPTAVKGRSSMR